MGADIQQKVFLLYREIVDSNPVQKTYYVRTQTDRHDKLQTDNKIEIEKTPDKSWK